MSSQLTIGILFVNITLHVQPPRSLRMEKTVEITLKTPKSTNYPGQPDFLNDNA